MGKLKEIKNILNIKRRDESSRTLKFTSTDPATITICFNMDLNISFNSSYLI